jgi:hypothetical protein
MAGLVSLRNIFRRPTPALGGVLIPDPSLAARSRVATIRPTVNRRRGEHVPLFEVQCQLCPWELSDRNGLSDSLSNVQELLNEHLMSKHARAATDVDLVKPGTETWR